jgi:hypothetical protein
MDLIFVLDSAIEYPLFLAFHPVTLSSAGAGAAASSKPFREATQLAFQVVALYFVEYTFGYFVLRRICFPSADSVPVSEKASKSTQPSLSGHDDHGTCDDAAHLAMEFLKPRGALLLAISVCCGAFHPLSMVIWAASRQMLS